MTSIIIPTPAARSVSAAHLSAGISPKTFAFSVGDILDVNVLKRLGNQKYLIQVNNDKYLANMQVNQTLGDKLKVRVESLRPDIILRIVSEESGLKAAMNEHLRFFRANPQGLLDLFTQARNVLTGESFQELSLHLRGSNWENLNTLLNSLIYSKAKATDPLYIRNIIHMLGLSKENPLLKGGAGAANPPEGPQSIKSLLIRISEDINILLKDKSLSLKALSELKSLESFTGKSIKAIEALQLVNVLSGDTENKYLLQIPILQQEIIRLTDIFIFKEPREEKAEGQERYWRFIIYLELEKLGELVVDLKAQGKNLDCGLLCKEVSTEGFVNAALPELGNKLNELGYVIKRLVCHKEANLNHWRDEFLGSQIFDAIELIDTFA